MSWHAPSRRRTLRIILFVSLALIFLIAVSGFTVHKTNPEKLKWVGEKIGSLKESIGGGDKCPMEGMEGGVGENWNRTVTKGPMTKSFRDALLQNEKYITSFMIAGWTNDVMAGIQLIYLSLLTSRIPILPPFYPTHVGNKAGIQPFSTFFDVTLLSKTLNVPILAWEENVKNTTRASTDSKEYEVKLELMEGYHKELYQINDGYFGGEDEDLGCWSLWMSSHGRGAGPREGELPAALGLDISWTPVPWNNQVDTTGAEEYVIYALSELDSEEKNAKELKVIKEGYMDWMQGTIREAEAKDEDVPKEEDRPKKIPVPNRLERQVDPDRQLLCFDYLYFSTTFQRSEFWHETSPMWNTVGTHLHFSPHILSLALPLLAKAFSLPSETKSEDLPLFVTVHIRREDFTGWCYGVPRDECLAPLSAYIKRVGEVKAELITRSVSQSFPKGPVSGKELKPEDIKVLVMTDEPRKTEKENLEEGEKEGWGRSEKWWDEVEKLGWKSLDHTVEGTAEKYGDWYPSIIDAALLSMGHGFVGTDRSTYSLIAKRRVEDWQHGPSGMVRWGNKGADDH